MRSYYSSENVKRAYDNLCVISFVQQENCWYNINLGLILGEKFTDRRSVELHNNNNDIMIKI